MVGIAAESEVSPHYGDIRDTLVQLPHNPWGGFGGSYVIADLFPVRHLLVSELSPKRIFEFGGYYGYCLVTMLDAARDCEWLGWCDRDTDANLRCFSNLRSYLEKDARGTTVELYCAEHVRDVALESFEADVVAVDGDHSYHGCLSDLTQALTMRPKLILVDDYTAIADVHAATHDFCSYFGLTIESYETVNGLAAIRPCASH